MRDRFAAATMIQRRQMIEDGLAKVLEPHFDLLPNGEGERCVVAPGWADQDDVLVTLWMLASELEALLA